LVGSMTDRWKVINAKAILFAVTNWAARGCLRNTSPFVKMVRSRTLKVSRLALVGSSVVLR
jgi:hypothetical protein